MRMKRTIAVGMAAPLLLLAACSSPQGGGDGGATSGGGETVEAIKIGTLSPLTGSAASYGEDTKQGTELAAEEINAREGACYDGAPVELIHEDDQATADGAITGATKLLERDRVSAIVGGASSTASVAATTVTRDRIVHINTMSQSDQITGEGGPFVFQLNNTVTQNSEQFNDWIVNQSGIEKFAYIGEDSVFNAGNFELLKRDMAAGGVEIVAEGVYPTETTDFSPILNRLHQAGGEALFIATGNPTQMANIIQQARQIGDFGEILIAAGNITPTTITAAGAPLEGARGGAIYTDTLDTPANKAFVEAFQAKYPGEIPGHPELVSYESVYIVCDAMTIAGTSTDQQAIATAIEGMTFDSPRGALSWDERHWPQVDYFFVVEVKDGSAVVVDQVSLR